jgi:hypothetical protein
MSQCGGSCLESQFLKRQRLGGSWFEISLGRKLEMGISANKLGLRVHVYNPSFEGGIVRRIKT